MEDKRILNDNELNNVAGGSSESRRAGYAYCPVCGAEYTQEEVYNMTKCIKCWAVTYFEDENGMKID